MLQSAINKSKQSDLSEEERLQIEARREEILERAKEAKAAYKSGDVYRGTAEEILKIIKNG